MDNYDLQRFEEIKQQLLRERSSNARNPFVDRSDEESYQRAVSEKEDSSAFRTITKIGMLGLAGYALGRTVPKDVWVDAIHKMGSYGKGIFGRYIEARNSVITGKVTRGFAGTTTSQLSDFLEEQARPFLYDIETSSANITAREAALRETRARLQERFGRSHPKLNKYTGLTVEDVLQLKASQANNFNVISQESYDVILRARRRLDPSGEWFDKLVIDHNLYRAKHGALGQSAIRDNRWASKRSLGEMAYNSLGFQIPFVGFRPVDLIAPFFRMGAKDIDFARVGKGVTVEAGIVAPTVGVTYMVGGKLMHYGSKGVTNLAPGRVFRAQKIDKFAEANLARLGKHPLQSDRLNQQGPIQTAQDFSSKLQDLAGFGPKYRSQPWAPSSVFHRAKEQEAIRSGQAYYRPYTNIKVHDLPFRERVKRQAEASYRGVRYDPGEVVTSPYYGNPIPRLQKLREKMGFASFGRVVDATDPTKSFTTEGWLTGNNAIKPGPLSYGVRPLRQGEKVKGFGKDIVTGVDHFVYEDKLSVKANIVGQFFTGRLNDLLGATTGMGFRPSSGRFGVLLNIANIAWMGQVLNPINGYAIDAIAYANYMFGRVTSAFGFAPWEDVTVGDIGIKAYEGVTLAAAGIKDVTGITAGSKYLEDLMPGLINSPLSGIARTVGPVLLGSRFGTKGILAGLGFAGLSGGISDVFGTPLAGAGLTTSSSELYEMYSGDRMVPVKKSRWWMMGKTPFYGEGIDRYEPHWVALAKSDWQYTNTLYGSKYEYFKHVSSLPTPHNFFGFGGDENYYSEKLSEARPYPVSASGEDINVGEMAPFNAQYSRGVDFNTLNKLGYGAPDSYTPPIAKETDYKYKEMFNTFTEFGGIYKFLGQMTLGDFKTGPVLESASNITDPRRLYWDKDLGGLFGATELLRRYFPKPNDINISEFVNNIPNQMPDFLPGIRSRFEGDRDSTVDFTVGDPYAKVKGGEYRLPGAGYESVHKLHSGQPGQYSVVDAFLILADVAPNSTAIRIYGGMINKMIASGELSDEWINKIEQAKQQMEDKQKGLALEFKERKFTNLDNISSVNQEIKYNALERTIGAAWERLTFDALPEAGRIIPFGGLITHKLFPHHTAEQDYLERVVYGSRKSSWYDPVESFIEPKFNTLVNENPLTAIGGAGLFSALTATTPASFLTRGLIGGSLIGGLSTARSIGYGKLEGGFIPFERQEETEVIDYFDKLEYMRYQKSIDLAESQGDPATARRLKLNQSRRTMVGLNLNNSEGLKKAYSAIPTQERPYFESFINAPEESRDSIMNMVPSYMGDIYGSIWKPGSVNRNTKEIMSNWLQTNELPDEDWGGWNLGYKKQTIMAKTMDTPDNSVSIDLHRQYISNRVANEASFIPNLGLELQNLMGDSTVEHNMGWLSSSREKVDMAQHSIRSGMQNVRVTSRIESSVDRSPHYRNRYKHDRRKNRNAYIEDRVR